MPSQGTKPRLHLIYIRHNLWIGFACQLRAALTSPDDDVKIVANADLIKLTKSFGLGDDEDLIIDRRLPETQLDYADITTYVQYSEPGIAEYQRLFQPLESLGHNVTMSFYADGYTNKIHSKDLVADLCKTSTAKPGVLLQMDIVSEVATAIPGVSGVQTVSSRTMASYVNAPVVKDIALHTIAALPPLSKDVLLVLMRPWGSDKYVKGRLKFDGGAQVFCNIISGLIDSIRADLGREVSILVHPDRRDAELCEATLDLLSQRYSLIRAAPDWPDQLSFDPFLYHFEDALGGTRLHIASFDSTASLPYIALDKGHTHYLGAPASALPPSINDSAAIRTVRIKLKSLREYLDKLAPPEFRTTPFDPLFFKVQKIAVTALAADEWGMQP